MCIVFINSSECSKLKWTNSAQCLLTIKELVWFQFFTLYKSPKKGISCTRHYGPHQTSLTCLLLVVMTNDLIRCGKAYVPPVWFLCCTSLNHASLVTNASVNFIIYLALGRKFRKSASQTFAFVCGSVSCHLNFLFYILWSSGKGQARIGKGWPLRRKASKLKPLPRAYTKFG